MTTFDDESRDESDQACHAELDVPESAVASQLSQALDAFLAELKAGRRPEPGAWLARYPELAEKLAPALVGLEILQQGTRQLRQDVEPPPQGQELVGEDFSSFPLGDYRLVRETGRGGMGIVYEAIQLSLGRRVALKVLPFASALDARQLQRFRMEANAAAQLQHGNIVAVHAVGCERGTHFYAMEYIEGQSLAAWIASLKNQKLAGQEFGRSLPEAPTRSPAGSVTVERTDARSLIRTVARIGLQAASALDYAHRQGVIHRDIKPGNLLFDAQEKVWIADFGLARTANVHGLTMTGDLVGTLQYMSPEQALGRRADIDHRSDLYSLGATLYELLTLERPFAGASREEMLRQIEHGEPVPLRARNPAIPVDLETIVQKALAKNPDERYPTGQDLAEDLRRFLDDRPILARRPTTFQKLQRWGRRRRTVLTIGAGTLILGLIAGLALSTGLVWRAHQRSRQALASESEQRRRAEARELLARRVVDDMYTQVAEQWLAGQSRMSGLQREFLEKALASYLELAEGSVGDPVIRYRTAQAYYRAGQIQAKLGQVAPPIESYRRAIEILDALAQDLPDEPDYPFDLFRVHMTLAFAESAFGRPDEAETEHRRAFVIAQKLCDRYPDDPRYRDALAHQASNLGHMLIALDRLQEAELIHRRGLAAAQELSAAHPGELNYSRNESLNLHCLAMLASITNRLGEAVGFARRELTLAGRLAKSFPDNATYQHELSGAQVQLAGFLADQREWTEAASLVRDALAREGGLIESHPALHEYSLLAVGAWGLLAEIELAAGKPDEARNAFQQQLRISEDVSSKLPDVWYVQMRLASTLALCACTDRIDSSRALRAARRGVELAPGRHEAWLVLAAARLRADDWLGCLAALGEMGSSPPRSKVTADFLGCMACARLGRFRQARERFERAARTMNQSSPSNLELMRLREEAGVTLLRSLFACLYTRRSGP